MWIVPWDPFLIKKLLKSEVCESCDWKVTGVHCSHPKVNNHCLKKKKKEEKEENTKRGCGHGRGKRKTCFPNAHLVEKCSLNQLNSTCLLSYLSFMTNFKKHKIFATRHIPRLEAIHDHIKNDNIFSLQDTWNYELAVILELDLLTAVKIL